MTELYQRRAASGYLSKTSANGIRTEIVRVGFEVMLASTRDQKAKTILLLYSPHYAEKCNELAVPISAS